MSNIPIKTVSFDFHDLDLFPAESTRVTLDFIVISQRVAAGVFSASLNGQVRTVRFAWNHDPATLPRIRHRNVLAPQEVYPMQVFVRRSLTDWSPTTRSPTSEAAAAHCTRRRVSTSRGYSGRATSACLASRSGSSALFCAERRL